ncbi:MAG TPA: aspartate/glutamate racemase family protein [Anaeromyxobacter sp.]|nr:aspartate/glutamate racemase family protein [Anaeromyxobacter sp.]
MPSALVVNPNTSPAMTEEIREIAERVFTPPWNCTVVCAPGGPESLESWRDYALAAVATMPLLEEHRSADGVVLACFGDPGLPALKEVAEVPVVGIAEAALSQALLLGGRLGILAGMSRAVPLMDALVRDYGLGERYAGTESLELRVLQLGADRAATLQALTAAAGRLARRGADVLVLGCAGLGPFRAELAGAVPLAVIDPVDAGCRALRALVEAGLSTGRAGLYARPPPQRMNRLEAVFSPGLSRLLERWGRGDGEVEP